MKVHVAILLLLAVAAYTLTVSRGSAPGLGMRRVFVASVVTIERARDTGERRVRSAPAGDDDWNYVCEAEVRVMPRYSSTFNEERVPVLGWYATSTTGRLDYQVSMLPEAHLTTGAAKALVSLHLQETHGFGPQFASGANVSLPSDNRRFWYRFVGLLAAAPAFVLLIVESSRSMQAWYREASGVCENCGYPKAGRRCSECGE